MGPVNWLAVILAVGAALMVAALWYGPIFGHVRRVVLALVLVLVPVSVPLGRTRAPI